MHGVSLLQDLAVVMIVAGIVTIIFHQFKQPVVLGYILAGVIIGPHTPPFPLINDEKTINTLAELGVIFLMFSLGLEFNLRKLKKVGATAFLAAVLEILLMFWVGFQIGRLFGWKTMDSIFLGGILSISSTTIIVRALAELGKTKERFADLIFGILIVEDILAIVMIAVLSGIAATGSLKWTEAARTLGELSVFFVAVLVVGFLTVPRLLRYVGKFKRDEMLVVTVLGLCFGVSLLAVRFDYSVALGAFMIGAVISEAREIGRVETLMAPIRDMFSAVFFVAIGLQIQPKLLVDFAGPILLITAAVVIGKVIACSFGTFVAGNDVRTSMLVGMGLAQIGEFSFIIASLGISLGVTSEFLYPIAVTVSAITTLLTPYLIRGSDPFVTWLGNVVPGRWLGVLDLYTRWSARVTETRRTTIARLIRRWTWQMLLNLLLVAAIFIGAAFLAQRRPDWVLHLLGGGTERLNAILWLAAMLASLPLLIATYRKLQALGLLLADIKLRGQTEAKAKGIHLLVANGVPIGGLAGIALLILLLSSAILPSIETLGLLLLLLVVITAILWRSFIRIYSKVQYALQETLAPNPGPAENPVSLGPLPKLMSEAELDTVLVETGSPAANKLIREIQLRTATGVSIVGIQRGEESIVNPGPDEELLPGDNLLLLGRPGQLPAGRKFLVGKEGSDRQNG